MERRKYERVASGANGSFFLRNNNVYYGEFTAEVLDISEHGIKFKADKEKSKILEYAEKDSSLNISFQALDEYQYMIGKERSVFSGTANLVYVEREGNDIYAGCYIQSPTQELLSYFEKKKISNYMKAIRP